MIVIDSVTGLLAFAAMSSLVIFLVFQFTSWINKKTNMGVMWCRVMHAVSMMFFLCIIIELKGSYAAFVTALLLVKIVGINMVLTAAMDTLTLPAENAAKQAA